MYQLDVKIVELKSSVKLLKSFSKRENNCYKYCLQLLQETIKHHYNSEKEMFFHVNKTKYQSAMREALSAIFRLQYILQTIDISASIDWEKYEIIITKKDY